MGEGVKVLNYGKTTRNELSTSTSEQDLELEEHSQEDDGGDVVVSNTHGEKVGIP